MNRITLLPILALLVCCGRSAPPDTVDSLATHPDRLKEVMRQCREDPAKAGSAECSAASEAFRRDFMGSGKAQYKPQP